MMRAKNPRPVAEPTVVRCARAYPSVASRKRHGAFCASRSRTSSLFVRDRARERAVEANKRQKNCVPVRGGRSEIPHGRHRWRADDSRLDWHADRSGPGPRGCSHICRHRTRGNLLHQRYRTARRECPRSGRRGMSRRIAGRLGARWGRRPSREHRSTPSAHRLTPAYIAFPVTRPGPRRPRPWGQQAPLRLRDRHPDRECGGYPRQ
jgi:hypothetical protein